MESKQLQDYLFEFIEFRRFFLQKEDDEYYAECKRIGGLFTFANTPDYVIAERFIKQISSPEKPS